MVSTEDLAAARRIMLDMMIHIDRICKKHNIEYWLDSGTLLGAVRHDGFIPWDDDVDITMTLEDYKIFCSVAQKELPESMFLQNSNTDKEFPLDFAKIRDSRGVIIEKNKKLFGSEVSYNQGIFVDIFPVITIKDGFYNKMLFTFLQLSAKILGYGYLNIPYLRDKIVRIHDARHQGWESKKTKVVRSALAPWPNELYIDVASIFSLGSLGFEGKDFSAPYDTHDYLTSIYGDTYMQLPPEDKRVVHATEIKIFEQ